MHHQVKNEIKNSDDIVDLISSYGARNKAQGRPEADKLSLGLLFQVQADRSNHGISSLELVYGSGDAFGYLAKSSGKSFKRKVSSVKAPDNSVSNTKTTRNPRKPDSKVKNCKNP